jgi:hypothetical protein
MENKRAAAAVGAVLSLGLSALLNADRLAKFFGIVNLPQDIKGALLAMSQVPTVLAFGVFATGVVCLVYLFSDQLLWIGSRIRKNRMELTHLMTFFLAGAILCTVGAGITFFYQQYQSTVRSELAGAPAQTAAILQNQRSPAVTAAPIQAPIQLRYEPEEISRMLKMIGKLRDIVDNKCSPTSSAISTALQTWRRDSNTEGAAGLATRFNDLRIAVNENWQAIMQVINDNQQFRDEIYPAIADDKNAFGEIAGALGDLSLDLRELAKGPDVNIERFITPNLQRVDIISFSQWVGLSAKRLSEKQKELREWRNP